MMNFLKSLVGPAVGCLVAIGLVESGKAAGRGISSVAKRRREAKAAEAAAAAKSEKPAK